MHLQQEMSFCICPAWAELSLSSMLMHPVQSPCALTQSGQCAGKTMLLNMMVTCLRERHLSALPALQKLLEGFGALASLSHIGQDDQCQKTCAKPCGVAVCEKIPVYERLDMMAAFSCLHTCPVGRAAFLAISPSSAYLSLCARRLDTVIVNFNGAASRTDRLVSADLK